MRKLELAVSCLTHTHRQTDRQRQTHNVIEVIKLLDTGVLQTCRFLAQPLATAHAISRHLRRLSNKLLKALNPRLYGPARFHGVWLSSAGFRSDLLRP